MYTTLLTSIVVVALSYFIYTHLQNSSATMTNKKTAAPAPRQTKTPPYTVEAPGFEKVKGETIPRRNAAFKDKLRVVPEEGVNTIYDVLRRGASKFGNAKAVGYRKVVQMHNETKKVKKMVDGEEKEVDKNWSYFELSEYKYMSFIEYERAALQAGAGLRKLGLEAHDRLHLFAATSPFWLSMAHGALTQSMAIVTAYDTLGEEGLAHSLAQTHAKAIFLDPHLLPKLVKTLTKSDIKHVIYNSDGHVKEADIDNLKEAYPNLTIQSYDELQALGEKNMVDPVPPKADDLCCIMYTSGSTGPPKGVLIKHRNVVGAIAGVNDIVGPYIGPGDGLLTYLPLAHILEFVFENACLFWGGTMGYGNVKTLSEASVKNCKGDIREFKPTILVGVPAVWESVKKGIITKVTAGGPVVSKLFWTAMATKGTLMSFGLPGSGILDTVVFNKVKDATGGKLRLCLNGGGPIAKDTQHFLSMAITPVLSGYGLTETCGMGALTDPSAWTVEALGELPSSVEIKLVDVPDVGYYTDAKVPQGEIWIRGAAVTEGYLDLEEENKKAYEDGWFKTGDIGEFDHKGNLKIIDRKKNLVKTLNGEYIALEKLESIYRSCNVVANICVFAAADKSKPVAIVVPAEPALKSMASANGIQGEGLESLIHDKKLNRIVLGEMQKAGRNGGLAGIEIIDGLVLADEEWNPANGLTTSAQKINRKGIVQKYQKEIDRAYAASS